MRWSIIPWLLLAPLAGVPAAAVRPPEFTRRRGREGVGSGRHQIAWRRVRAERALARLDVARIARAGRAVLVEASVGLAYPPGHEVSTSMQLAATSAIVDWRRLRNAAKRRRRAIRAAGGKAA